MQTLLFNTPIPTQISPYPPNIPVSGSTLPLIWGAFILVIIVLAAMAFYKSRSEVK